MGKETPAKLKRRTGENTGVYDEVARTKIERETIITYNEEEATAVVYTFNIGLNHKLARLATEHPDQCKFIRNLPEGAVEFEVPKKWVKVSPPRSINMTDEQKKAMAERLNAARIDSDGVGAPVDGDI